MSLSKQSSAFWALELVERFMVHKKISNMGMHCALKCVDTHGTSQKCIDYLSDGFISDFLYICRYTTMLEELKKNPESHGGPPDCIV